MVGRRGSRPHQWVGAGLAVLVLGGGEQVRAQLQESAGRNGYTALVTVPVHGGEPGGAEGDGIGPTLGPPSNLVIPASHRELVRAMWGQSGTFRRQCQRIGRARTLTVNVHTFRQTRTADAITRLVHRPGSGLVADLYLAQLDRIVELLAHELEHIIERLEGIDVGQLSRRVPHLVWSTADGSYETRRAIHSGQTVASEVVMAQK